MIDTTGLDQEDVLAALYDGSQPLGLGFLAYKPGSLTREDCRELLAESKYFDYLHGRLMKVDLSNPDGFEERLYDRDLGAGHAQHVIAELRKRKGNGNGTT